MNFAHISLLLQPSKDLFISVLLVSQNNLVFSYPIQIHTYLKPDPDWWEALDMDQTRLMSAELRYAYILYICVSVAPELRGSFYAHSVYIFIYYILLSYLNSSE